MDSVWNAVLQFNPVPKFSHRPIIVKPYKIAVFGQKHNNTFNHPGVLSYDIMKGNAVPHQVNTATATADVELVEHAHIRKHNAIKQIEYPINKTNTQMKFEL